jgi:putative flavoprotein involved in K+ transport
MALPRLPGVYPTKDETADYLEAYARAFELPVRTGVRVDRLAKSGDRFDVVVATGTRGRSPPGPELVSITCSRP